MCVCLCVCVCAYVHAYVCTCVCVCVAGGRGSIANGSEDWPGNQKVTHLMPQVSVVIMLSNS